MCEEKTFDELVDLFKQDPVGFDEYKHQRVRQHIADMCTKCPEHLQRCQRFQWRLDQELAKHKNPLVRYNKMVEMFWKQVDEFKLASQYKPTPKAKKSGTIIPFSQKE